MTHCFRYRLLNTFYTKSPYPLGSIPYPYSLSIDSKLIANFRQTSDCNFSFMQLQFFIDVSHSDFLLNLFNITLHLIIQFQLLNKSLYLIIIDILGVESSLYCKVKSKAFYNKMSMRFYIASHVVDLLQNKYSSQQESKRRADSQGVLRQIIKIKKV